jgi:apolipoprotein N-acyltransferase
MKSFKLRNFFPDLAVYAVALFGFAFALAPRHSPNLREIIITLAFLALIAYGLHKNHGTLKNDKSSRPELLAFTAIWVGLAFLAWWIGNFKDPVGQLGWLILALSMIALGYYTPELSRWLRNMFKGKHEIQ